MFHNQEAVLVKDSDYFDKALNGPFSEAQSQTIDFRGDIKAEESGISIDTLNRLYSNKNFNLCNNEHSVADTARLWMLSDWFLNRRLCDIATKGFIWRLRFHDADSWITIYLPLRV